MAVYIAAIIVLTALFVFFVILPANGNGEGFVVSVNDQTAFIYDYESKKYEIKEFDGYIEMGDADLNGTFYFTVFTKDGGYNVIEVVPNEKTVRVSESNCSSKKDCVFTPAVKNGSGAIFCMPHGLKILPLKEKYRSITTGGL